MKSIFTIFICFAIFNVSKAQDSHFSQFYASPMLLNPALTGVSSYKLKATAQYRQQWNSVTVPYISMQSSIVKRWDVGYNNKIGGGLFFSNRQSGDAQFRNPQIFASGAFHKGLDHEGHHLLSIGGQFGFSQRSISENLTFNSQFDGTIFNLNISSGEQISNPRFSYFDGSVGLAYVYAKDEQSSFYGGLSLFHLNRPNISFTTEMELLNRRIVFYSGGSFPLNDRLTLLTQAIFMKQGLFTEMNIGAMIKYDLLNKKTDKKIALTLGTTHRFGDAQILVGRLDYDNISLGMAYDINFSTLAKASNIRGGYEMVVIYQFDKIEKGTGCPIW